MASNPENFIIKANTFEGFNDLANRAERRDVRDDAQIQKGKANKDKLTAYLMGMADPKELLSGSPYDPHIIKGYYDIIGKGAKLIQDNEGMDYNDLVMAIGPEVNQLAQYAEKAKIIKQGVDKRLEGIGENSGYEKFKLNQEARREAFYDDDGKLKDISTIDPSIDYVQQTVTKRPEMVTNNKGLDEWLSKQKMITDSNDIVNINSAGRKARKKVKQNAYGFAIPEVDANGVHTRKFIPKYDTAIEAGEDIIHEGKQVPLLDETTFNSIIGNSPGTMDWLRGQVNTALKSGEFKDGNGDPIKMDSPQAKNYARAILFEELKNRGLGGMEDFVENKAAQITNNNNSGSGKGAKEVNINDTYKKIYETTLDPTTGIWATPPGEQKRRVGTRLNKLDTDGINVITDFVNKGRSTPIAPENLFIHNEDDKVKVYQLDDDGKPIPSEKTLLGTLPYTGTNLKTQANAPAKAEVVKKGNLLQRAKNALTGGGKGKKTYKGLDKNGNPIFE